MERLFGKPECSIARCDVCAYRVTRDVAIRFDVARIHQTPLKDVADELGIVRKRSR